MVQKTHRDQNKTNNYFLMTGVNDFLTLIKGFYQLGHGKDGQTKCKIIPRLWHYQHFFVHHHC